MKVDVTVTVAPPVPFLLRTAHDVRRLCESLGYLPPQLPEQAQALPDTVDRQVERPQSLLRDDAAPEVAHALVGVRLGDAIARAGGARS